MNFRQSSILLLAVVCSQLQGFGQLVYKTPSGKKYHLESCRMVKNFSEEITIQEALKLGLGPCSICKPSAAYALIEIPLDLDLKY